MRRLDRRTLGGAGILVAAALAGIGGAASAREPVVVARPVGPGLPQEADGLSAVESGLISRTNAARAQRGLPPLAADGMLMQSARSHARWMASNRRLAHGTGVTENIAMGQTSAAEAVASWMNSSGHRGNILGTGHSRIGVAVARGPDGSLYWCQQFR